MKTIDLFSLSFNFKSKKSIFYLIFFFLLFTNKIYSICDSYCLKCSSSNKCLLCDFTNKKVLDPSGNCVESSFSDCQFAYKSTTCNKCSSNLKFDSSLKQCVSGDLKNCLIFDSNGKCVLCNEKFYIDSSGNCVEIIEKETITNCYQYQKITVQSDSGEDGKD